MTLANIIFWREIVENFQLQNLLIFFFKIK